jgi:hypothetical protein
VATVGQNGSNGQVTQGIVTSLVAFVTCYRYTLLSALLSCMGVTLLLKKLTRYSNAVTCNTLLYNTVKYNLVQAAAEQINTLQLSTEILNRLQALEHNLSQRSQLGKYHIIPKRKLKFADCEPQSLNKDARNIDMLHPHPVVNICRPSRAPHELCLVHVQLKTVRLHPTGNVTKARNEFLKEVANTHRRRPPTDLCVVFIICETIPHF